MKTVSRQAWRPFKGRQSQIQIGVRAACLNEAMDTNGRNLLAFVLGCAGVAAAFWGVLESLRLHHALALASVPLGLGLVLAAFRVAPGE